MFMNDAEKKEIIKKVVEMMRPSKITLITRVLTNEEELLKDKPNELVCLVQNNMNQEANDRLDEILKINEIF